MMLSEKLSNTLQELASISQKPNTDRGKDIISLMDLTLLDATASAHDIRSLAGKAIQHQVAAICIFQEHINYLPPDIQINCATVVNFPSGDYQNPILFKEIEQSLDQKLVHEIDYVFPYQAYLTGRQDEALTSCREAYLRCKDKGVLFKVILETGALPSDDMIYHLSKAVINAGCDFLKTSTGKIATGATIPAAFAMLTAIAETNSHCGIKISGGVKTMQQALTYMQLAEHLFGKPVNKHWFRIGASSLLDEVLQQMALRSADSLVASNQTIAP